MGSRGVKKGAEYATLTDIITQGWSSTTTRRCKQYKGLKTESLRDNMTNLELVLNVLAEATTKDRFAALGQIGAGHKERRANRSGGREKINLL